MTRIIPIQLQTQYAPTPNRYSSPKHLTFEWIAQTGQRVDKSLYNRITKNTAFYRQVLTCRIIVNIL